MVNVCTTMIMSTSIISVNNVCSICLRALGNTSLLMSSIRVRKFLHTSPLFLIQCINQDSRVCCFHNISCSISIKFTLHIVANIVTVCQYDRHSHKNYVLSVCLSVPNTDSEHFILYFLLQVDCTLISLACFS
jgi:hypothetical protein